MKKNLTLPYSLHQMAYWATAAGIISFATAFLLEKGFSASTVGILLAAGNLLSCAVQPVLADRADRMGGRVLKWMSLILTAICFACFGAILLVPMGAVLFGVLYLLGIFSFDAVSPLLNAIHVFYTGEGCRINYGLGRGLGSLAYSLAALGIGKLMARFGGNAMILVCLLLMAINIAATLTYPDRQTIADISRQKTASSSIPVFFRRYPWYCLSLLGVMAMGIFHAMTENYLIEIVTPLGGDSGSVGIALFIATGVEAAVLVYFSKVRKVISTGWLLKIAALSFLLKSFLFLLARDVWMIYLIQLLQATSYTFLSPTQMYYATEKIPASDMVKGQAFITAAYTLGCAGGNFLGGQLLSYFDLRTMLVAGVAIAAAGTAVFFLTVDRRDVELPIDG